MAPRPFGCAVLAAGALEVPHDEATDGTADVTDSGASLHSATRQAARLAPPPHVAPSPAAPPPGAGATPPSVPRAPAPVSLEDLLPGLVRRAAWSGDGRRGSLRLEFGAGVLAGATLLVQADDGHVRVRLTVPPGVDAAGWRSRISTRLKGLQASGVDVDSVEVD